MATDIIDGRIVGAKLKRAARRQSVFDTIIFQLPDGSRRTLRKLAVSGDLADALTPGTSGRFYLHSIVDQHGLHAIRTHDGRAIFDYSRTVETILLVIGLLNLMLTGAFLMLEGEVRTVHLLFFLLGSGLALLFRRTRNAARSQFDDDADVVVHNGLVRPVMI
jgi:hypothetical protein